MNSMTIVGNLTKDPVTRNVNTPTGTTSVTNFTVGCKGRSKEKRYFVRVTAWGEAGKTIAKYTAKGSGIMVRGEPDVSAYLDSNGNPQATLELRLSDFEFLSKSASGGSAESDQGYSVTADTAFTAESAIKAYEAIDASSGMTIVDDYDEEETDLPF